MEGLIDLSFIGNIADAIPKVTGQFNGDYLDAQVKIAEANARAAENTPKSEPPTDKKWIIAIAAIAIIVVLFLVLKK